MNRIPKAEPMTTNYHRSFTQHTAKQPLAIDANTVSRLAEMVSHTIGFDPERIGVNSIVRAAHEVQGLFKGVNNPNP